MPKVVDHSERRSHFIDASLRLIAEDGLNAATLRKVAEAAGVTTGALTHYFCDRETLLVEALRAAHFAAGARMAKVVAAKNDESAKLMAVLEEALPLDNVRMQEWRVWLAFWGEALGSERLTEENERRVSEWRELVRTLVTPLVPVTSSADLVAMSIVALVDGLGVRVALASRRRVKTERANARATIAYAVTRLVAAVNEQQADARKGE